MDDLGFALCHDATHIAPVCAVFVSHKRNPAMSLQVGELYRVEIRRPILPCDTTWQTGVTCGRPFSLIVATRITAASPRNFNFFAFFQAIFFLYTK